MASSFSDSAPTYSTSQSCNCDVFLSFRGEDTRKTFVDHLYSALVDSKISTYKDDETLGRGEVIRPSLFKAIEGSKVAVIIFSENYANSSWCLEELAHIMKCKDERKLIVMPIFYGVVPSEVRKQEGDFGKGFAKQEEGNIKKVETWRKALVDACEIAGWETKNIANGHESKGIKEIVDTVSNKLFSITPGVDEDLVGMKARLEELEAKLKIGSNGVRMVGIWGCGGSGKTTLASSIYTKISSQFQGHCIIDSIREKSNKHGLETLQEKILSRLLNTKVEVQSVEKGKDMIRSRLGHSNVLILLDDVDNYKQLDALAGSHNWFGSGSRIIITTRDEHLLITHKVDHVCPVKLLSHDEAVKLFNKRAYNEKKPVKGYGALSSSVVSYAAGLPLALKVLGSFLFDRDEKEWMSTLIRLKDTPPTEILEQLKISYDGLESVDKDLFLDIACFFRKESIDKAINIFKACGYHPDIGITMLREKALITVMDGKFDMHDLIQEMGHNIVRKEHPKNPEKHSRLWKDEEIKTMCLGVATMENHKIEAIQYDGDPSLFCKIVSNKKRLRWLSLTKSINYNVKDVRNVEAPSFLSNELCYIHLEYYPKSPFPDSFQPMKLVTLKLVNSLQEELWKGNKRLLHLKELELFKMKNLLSTPDFDGLPYLQKLKLEDCNRLKRIHPSLGNHACIEDVCVSLCCKIRMFPTIIQMGNLKTLEFLQCSRQLEFPKIKSNMESLVKVSLSHMGIDVLLSSIGEERFPNLSSLNLTCCYLKNREANYYAFKHLEEFILIGFSHFTMPSRLLIPLLIGKVVTGRDRYESARLTWLPSVLSQSTHSLQKLDLSCCGLREIPAHIGELSNLRELNLNSNNFSRLDFSLLPLTRLKFLNLSYCELVELPELPSSLAILEAYNCNSLTTIGEFHKNCKWICQVSFLNTFLLTDSSMLLHSMLQGKAIENQSMHLKLEGLEIAKGFTPPLVRGRTYKLNLPENWCNDFCGFLMCAVVKGDRLFNYQRIDMDNRMSDMDSEDDVAWEESDGDMYTCVFYVSFSTLQDSPWWNSTYKAISISNIHLNYDSDPTCNAFGVRLVARKRGSGPTETSPTQEESEFSHYTPKFEISHTPTTLKISFQNSKFDRFSYIEQFNELRTK